MSRRQTWDLSNSTGRENFDALISQMILAGKRPRVQILPDKRTLDQNAMIYALYGEIASQVEDQSVREIRRECKLLYGVPILRADDSVFNAFFHNAIDCLDYESQLAAMDFVDVTSLMGTEQCTKFIDEVIRVYSQQGISIIHPSEREAWA